VAAKLPIRAVPRAGRNEIAGEREGRVLVRVTAPPVDGKANAAVCAVVAKAAGVAKGRVSVVRGASSRDKLLAVEGVGDVELRRALGL
jgi:uncharacterized protein (TIGR00251 family)